MTGEIILIMKLMIFILFFCLSSIQPTASGEAQELKTYSMEVELKKNEINTFKIPFSGDNRVIIEITKQPQNLKILPYSEKMSIICLPDEGFSGKDCFYFRFYDGEIVSNISKCTITVGEEKAKKKSARQKITERIYRSKRI